MAPQSIKTMTGLIALTSFAGVFFLYEPIAAAWLKIPIPTFSFSGLPTALSGVEVAPYEENPTLIIPKLGINAPIVKNVPVANQADYDKALQSGIALAEGTAGLEAADGNSFMFAHSSAPKGTVGGFNTIFAALPSVQIGDEVQISVGGRLTTYTVETSKAIEASDVQYLDRTDTKKLTLLTCWPPGTTYKRWVVQAVKEG